MHKQHVQEKARLSSLEQDSSVRWYIGWRTPFFIALWTYCGIGWAVGHHTLYRSLDGEVAGSPARQTWAVGFGTALAFLVVASLRAACDVAYKQHI